RHRAGLCVRSPPSLPTGPPSHAAFPTDGLQTRLAPAPHAAIATMAPPQVLSASQQNQASRRKPPELRARSRSSPPSRSSRLRPQHTRLRVPKTHRFRHSVPWLSSISRCVGPTHVVPPFHHLAGDSHLHPSLGAGPITASS